MEIEEGLRNRVVGATIITVLATIFLPMLLNDPKEENREQISSELGIPEKPMDSPSLTATILPDNAEEVLETTTVAEETVTQESIPVGDEFKEDIVTKVEATTPEIPVETAPVNSQQLTTTVAEPQNLKPPRLDAPPRLNSSPNQAGRWFIQVASFSEQKNATSLRDKLRAQGFSATVESVWTKKGRIYKLRVGPELDRQRAETIKNKLNQLNNVKSIVVSN